MQLKGNPSHDAKFSRATVVLHWFSVLAVLAAYAMGWGHEFSDSSDVNDLILFAHRQTGLLVFVVLVLRVFFRLIFSSSQAQLSSSSSRWFAWLGALSHLVLYFLLASMPLLGWAMTNAQGHSIHVLGLLKLPDLVPLDPDWADTLQEWHELCGQILCIAIVLHVMAALFHHLVLKDSVLSDMLVLLRKRKAVQVKD